MAIQHCTCDKNKHQRKELHSQNHKFRPRLHFIWLHTAYDIR